MSKIYVIHENRDWFKPLELELSKRGLPFEEWFLNDGHFDMSQEPPNGVFYNRMSASSHTRGHRYAPEYTACVLNWLQMYGRKVFNPSRALYLEISKVAQYSALSARGIAVPRTIAVSGRDEVLEAARAFDKPFITKHNRAGKGLGVRKFDNRAALESYVGSGQFEESVDGITLLQDYIKAPGLYITRCEFIGGKFLYAVRIDTRDGFELCPADVCQIDDLFCPVTGSPRAKFEIIRDFSSPLIPKYEAFLEVSDIHIAGIEFIEDEHGQAFTYDVNTNTNYNSDAERVAGISGMGAIAELLGKALNEI
ncbi:MAG: hypothetical protein FWE20_12445 [Defluviitaleaceae bacterium]|nr:hypothetical protein [Defluviitaleaceae bacterium]